MLVTVAGIGIGIGIGTILVSMPHFWSSGSNKDPIMHSLLYIYRNIELQVSLSGKGKKFFRVKFGGKVSAAIHGM